MTSAMNDHFLSRVLLTFRVHVSTTPSNRQPGVLLKSRLADNTPSLQHAFSCEYQYYVHSCFALTSL